MTVLPFPLSQPGVVLRQPPLPPDIEPHLRRSIAYHEALFAHLTEDNPDTDLLCAIAEAQHRSLQALLKLFETKGE